MLTVPNHASLAEEIAIKHAAQIAGFKNISLISESVALALSYGYYKRKFMFKDSPNP